MATCACQRCGQVFGRKDYLVKHLSRKQPCRPRSEDVAVSSEELLACLSAADAAKKTVACACGRLFASKDSLRYHRARHCKHDAGELKPSQPQVQDDGPALLADLQRQVDELSRQLQTVQQQQQGCSNSNNNNTTNSNNTEINIIVNSFGHETRDHMPPKFVHQCVKRRDKGLLELLQMLHYSPDVPGNRTVKCTSVKRGELMVHDDGMWQYRVKNDVVRAMVDNGHVIMQEHFEDHEDRLREEVSPTMFAAIQEWMNAVREEDKPTMASLLERVYNIIRTHACTANGAGS